MEKTKKRLSKKTVIIGSVVLAVVLVVGGVFIYKYATREKLYTFDEITQGLSEQVSYVVDADGELTQEEIDEVYERYKKGYFVELTEDTVDSWVGIGEAQHQLLFNDKDNNILFKIIDRRYSCISIAINTEWYDYKIVNK